MKDPLSTTYHIRPVEPSTEPGRSQELATTSDDLGTTADGGTQPFVYGDGLAHLEDELVFVRALLSRYLSRRVVATTDEDQALGGLAVGPEEIQRFLAGATPARDEDQETFLVELRRTIDERVASTRSAGVSLPLVDLAEAFGLSPLEAQVLLVLMAPEVEPEFERAYAYAWNDFTRKTPDVGFVLGMLSGDFRVRAEWSLVFGPTEGLVGHGLVEVDPSDGPVSRSFLARRVRLVGRVVSYILGDPTPDERLHGACRVIEARARREDIVLQTEDLDRVWSALKAELGENRSRVSLRGLDGCGKKLLLEAALTDAGGALLCLDLAALLERPLDLERALRAGRREAILLGAALYLDCTGVELDDESQPVPRSVIERSLGDFPGLLAFGASQRVPFFSGPRGELVDIHLPIPEPAERQILWEQGLPRRLNLEPGLDLEKVARQHPLSGGAIAAAARDAVARARRRDPAQMVVHREDVAEAARQQLTGKLSHLATRVTNVLSWDDLVLPEDALDGLRDLTAYARHRKKVFEQWGFGAILPYGRGLTALFHGPPGTGKTMVAGIISGELGMDLFRVDLSRIVSKYVGETEKNLARIFDEASQSHSVLLFDEADSLFSKRTQVKSATDRYANLEVNYLLQRMEDFEGVTILTTNFESGLDDAFKRRLRFRIRFPSPDEEARGALWQKMLPPQALIEDTINFEELAYDFELTGGHIKNAVLRAAFSAAQQDRGIRHEDLRAAGAQECREIGKLVREWPNEDEEETS